MSSILKQSVTALTAAALVFAACQSDNKKNEDDGSGLTGTGLTSTTQSGPGGTGGSTTTGTNTGGSVGSEDCTNGIDDDGDTFIDCADFDCKGTPSCIENSDALCADGQDNDGDGLTDCADPGCNAHPDVTICKETNCSDGIDDDLDTYIDCNDKDCLATAAGGCWDNGADNVEAGPGECDDDVDNDGDGFTDCDDNSCRHSVPSCREDNATACMDNVDNNDWDDPTKDATSVPPDNFGRFIDCDAGTSGGDFGCIYGGFCASVEESTDADCSDVDGNGDPVDNDGDGFANCDDWSCQRTEGITVCEGNAVTCSDGINNDTIADPNTTNTFVDCDDFRCCSAGGYIADTCDPSQCP